MNKAAEILKMLPKNEATKGSKKIDAMLTWASSPEVEAAGAEDKANEILTGMLHMYDISDLSGDDALEIFDIAKKNSGAEIYMDGDIIWMAKDVSAAAAAMQKVAQQFKLDIPRF